MSELRQLRESCEREKEHALAVAKDRLTELKNGELQKLRDTLGKDRDQEIRVLNKHNEELVQRLKADVGHEKDDAVKVALELQKKALSEQRDLVASPGTTSSALVVRLQRENKQLKETNQLLNSSMDQVLNSSKDQLLNSSKDQVLNSSKDQVLNSSKDQLLNSSKDQLLNSSKDQLLNSSKDQLLNSSKDQVLNSSKDQVLNSSKDQVLNSSKDQVLNSSKDQVLNSSKDQVLNSSKDQVLNSSKDQELNSSKDVSGNCDTVAEKNWLSADEMKWVTERQDMVDGSNDVGLCEKEQEIKAVATAEEKAQLERRLSNIECPTVTVSQVDCGADDNRTSHMDTSANEDIDKVSCVQFNLTLVCYQVFTI